MRTIALEEHLLPKDIASAVGQSSMPPALADPLDDLGQGRLDTMDAAGIDVQVLSLVGHDVQELEASRAVSISRDANDRMAAAVAAHPDRFRAFATLPMSDPQAAAAELRRAVGHLGFVGTMIHVRPTASFSTTHR